MTRLEKLISERFDLCPQSCEVEDVLNLIEDMKEEYDKDLFLEEDIEESILIELDII